MSGRTLNGQDDVLQSVKFTSPLALTPSLPFPRAGISRLPIRYRLQFRLFSLLLFLLIPLPIVPLNTFEIVALCH